MRAAVVIAGIFALAPTRAGAPGMGAPLPPAFVPVVEEHPTIVRRDLVAAAGDHDRRWVRAVRDLVEARFDVDALPSWAPITVWTVADELVAFEVTTPEGETAFATRASLARDGAVTERWVFEDGTSLDGPVLARPVRYHAMSSKIGRREHPLRRRIRFHAGTDYAAPVGTPVRAVADGVVVRSERSWTAGNYIIIRHDGPAAGLETKYLHLHRRAAGIAPGVRVRQGQLIGEVGKTGRVTGPHLHFEVRRFRAPLDPTMTSWPAAAVIADARALRGVRLQRELLRRLDGQSRSALLVPLARPTTFVERASLPERDPRALLPPLAPLRPVARARLTPPLPARRRRRPLAPMKPLFDDGVGDLVLKDPLLRRAIQLALDFPDDPTFRVRSTGV